VISREVLPKAQNPTPHQTDFGVTSIARYQQKLFLHKVLAFKLSQTPHNNKNF